MERRNWSLKSLQELRYIDSLDEELRAKSLESWTKKYLDDEDFLGKLDLSVGQLEQFSELFFKNIAFLKEEKNKIQSQLSDNQKIQKFFS
jgi:hypothetical protein